MKAEDLEVNISANTEELQDALDDVKQTTDMLNRPNVIVRNRGDVYLTINYWNNEPEDTP